MAAPTNGAAARDRTEFYGGASRFELELEVSRERTILTRVDVVRYSIGRLTANTVRPIPLKPILPQPPRQPEVFRRRGLCLVLQVPEVLYAASIPLIPVVSSSLPKRLEVVSI